MKTRILFVSMMLFFMTFQMHAQLSVGIKVNKMFTEYTDENAIVIISRMQESEFSYNFETGHSITGLFYFNINKFIAFGIEPGFSKKNGGVALDTSMEMIDLISPTYTNRIYLESPMKMKLRLPLLNNKFGVYSSFGINPHKHIMDYNNNNKLFNGSMTRRDSEFMENWALKKLVGVGIDVNLGQHSFVVDCDFLTKIDKNRPDSQVKLKDTQIGIGYLVTL